MDKRGITFIEILVAISVIIILITVSISSFYLFGKKTVLDTTAKNIVSTLRFAQNKTLASEQTSQYGIYFDTSTAPDRFILFKGSNYSLRDPLSDQAHNIASPVEIYEINLGSGQEVVFNRLNGETFQPGNIKIRLTNNTSITKTISIDSSGRIFIGLESASYELPPQTDSRHVHFNLGWSIQNSSLLILNFPDTPEVTENIDMLPYFNADKTEFNLERSIPVNGETQKLRIHTHLLDAVNTALSITRDGRENSKPLNVSIDSKNIASYTATGSVSVGVYGGTMEIQ